jgi:hypothetical protein
MKDMGGAAYIFEVKIERDRSNKMLALSQEHYIKKKYLKSFVCKTVNPLILLEQKTKVLD